MLLAGISIWSKLLRVGRSIQLFDHPTIPNTAAAAAYLQQNLPGADSHSSTRFCLCPRNHNA